MRRKHKRPIECGWCEHMIPPTRRPVFVPWPDGKERGLHPGCAREWADWRAFTDACRRDERRAG